MTLTHILKSLGLVATASLALTLPGPAEARRAECYVKTAPPVIYRNWLRRDIVEPGVYEVTRTPSRYGFVQRKVVTHPGSIVWHEEPAVYKTVPVKVRVGGGYAWKRCSNDVMCRIPVPARYEVREKRVLVRGGRRIARKTPPTFAYVTERVLLKPYRNISHYHRPQVRWHRERVVIQPEGYRWTRTHAEPRC